MPLKETVLGLVADHRGLVDELGAANTVVAGPAGWSLWNTDPAGVTGAVDEASLVGLSRAVVLGAGATARSVICALARDGVSAVTICSRDRDRSRLTLDYATSTGCDVTWLALEDLAQAGPAELVVSTLPNGVTVASDIPQALVAGSALLDVTYDPWPSPLAMRWQHSPHPVLSGVTMLLHQAVAQIRIFISGNPDTPLPDEAAVVHAMRDAIA
jgi:shikimate dehydrogenase